MNVDTLYTFIIAYACANPIIPDETTGMIRVNYTADTEVPFGTTVEYK